jgi:hypothetical protein
MGLKDWWAGNVAGPKAYGDFIGRDARESGLVLANVLFISHGARLTGGTTNIFDTQAEMEAAGYRPRFSEIVEIDFGSLTKDEQLLFRSLQRAMIFFAGMVNLNVALQYMRRENTTKFQSGLRPSLLRSMVKCGLFDRIETAQAEVLSYASLVNSASASIYLNMDKPGSGDFLEQFIVRAVEASGSTLHYGFIRTGLTGFDLIALRLAQETVKAIYGVVTKYGW